MKIIADGFSFDSNTGEIRNATTKERAGTSTLSIFLRGKTNISISEFDPLKEDNSEFFALGELAQAQSVETVTYNGNSFGHHIDEALSILGHSKSITALDDLSTESGAYGAKL